MITLNGQTLVPDISGALFWEDEATVVVADLHFERASSFAERGRPLPPYDTTATLSALKNALYKFAPKRVICLGDSFHDYAAPDRLSEASVSELRDLTGQQQWIWVAGNHDPDPPAHLGGQVVNDFCLGSLTFRHEAHAQANEGELSGHYHPKATVKTRGRRVTRPCFVTDGIRLILPAFGSFTGGLRVTDPAIRSLLGEPFDVFLLGTDQVHKFPDQALSGS